MTEYLQSVGEFGVVYKAHLVRSAQEMPTFVAVKTLKGQSTLGELIHYCYS